MLEAALELVDLGLHVHPIWYMSDGRCGCGKCSAPAKHPRLPNWPKVASNNKSVAELWWGEQYPRDGVGVACGNELVVIDLDGKAGRDTWNEIGVDSSWVVRTGGGGEHHYYRTTEPVSNSVRKLGPGVDVRSEGGYVVGAGSLHKSGNRYTWLRREGALPELPNSVLERLQQQEVSAWKPSDFENSDNGVVTWPYGMVPEGDGRNNKMASFVGKLLREGLKPEEAYGLSRSVNNQYCIPPLPEAELTSIMRSIVGREERRCRAEGRPVPWDNVVDLPVRRTGKFHLVKASTLKYMPVDWIWPQRLASGKITIIDGDPGTGKSGLTLDIAARLSRGDKWPDGHQGYEPSDVIVINGEDDPNDTIMPRLVAAGANCDRVHVVAGEQNRLPSLPDSLGDLEELINEVGAKLLIVDPIMAFLSSTISSSSDQEVRRALTPLATMAGRTGCAVLVVRHLNKRVEHSALQRGGGSMGIIGAARLGFLLTRDKNDKTRSILSPTKSNLSALADTRAYKKRTTDTGVLKIEWEPDPILMDADEAIGGDAGKDAAVAFLRSRLADGAVPLDTLDGEAKGSGHSAVSLAMAKLSLGVSVTTNQNGVRHIALR